MTDAEALVKEYALKAKILGLRCDRGYANDSTYLEVWVGSGTCFNFDIDNTVGIWATNRLITAPIENHEEVWNVFVSLIGPINKWGV